jgi:DNA-binding NarL/FixJ family response regulator
MAPIPQAATVAFEDDPRARDLELTDPDALRVLIADAQPVVRAGFRAVLEGARDLAVAGTAATVEEVVALVGEIEPDVVLLDLELPDVGGIEATRRILADTASGAVKVMILAAHDDEDEVFASLRTGARGFLLKSTEPVDLLRAVRVVAAGDALLSPWATRRLIAEFASRPQLQLPSPEQLDELTAREREVMSLVAAGLRNEEIAERFVIGQATVKTHVSRALRKLGARDRAQLVAIAYQVGLVLPGSRPALRVVPAGRSPDWR